MGRRNLIQVQARTVLLVVCSCALAIAVYRFIGVRQFEVEVQFFAAENRSTGNKGAYLEWVYLDGRPSSGYFSCQVRSQTDWKPPKIAPGQRFVIRDYWPYRISDPDLDVIVKILDVQPDAISAAYVVGDQEDWLLYTVD
jgi:hypothetical protein